MKNNLENNLERGWNSRRPAAAGLPKIEEKEEPKEV
jgi:hypothetical protein